MHPGATTHRGIKRREDYASHSIDFGFRNVEIEARRSRTTNSCVFRDGVFTTLDVERAFEHFHEQQVSELEKQREKGDLANHSKCDRIIFMKIASSSILRILKQIEIISQENLKFPSLWLSFGETTKK